MIAPNIKFIDSFFRLQNIFRSDSMLIGSVFLLNFQKCIYTECMNISLAVAVAKLRSGYKP
jgi:hypothetical protein